MNVYMPAIASYGWIGLMMGVSTTQPEAAIVTDAYQSASRRLETAQTDVDKHAAYTHLDVDQLRAERAQALN